MSDGRPQIPASEARFGAVVAHWKNEDHLDGLLAKWPAHIPMVIVDNSSTLRLSQPSRFSEGPPSAQAETIVVLDPGRNLGFGAAVDRGVSELARRWPELGWVLVLNPDIVPRPGALEALGQAIERYPEAVGLVPALEGEAGDSQCAWQLQPVPSAITLWAQTFFAGGRRGPRREPPEGTPIGQPAAAALALRRRELAAVGGFGDTYFPAWFEDVDLARRFAEAGHRMLFVPEARFVHAMGSSIPSLGYGPFLWIYYRHLERYLRRHHGRFWVLSSRFTLPIAMALRLLLLPLRQPKRATSRSEAARGLWGVILGSLSGWRWPRDWAERFSPGVGDSPPATTGTTAKAETAERATR